MEDLFYLMKINPFPAFHHQNVKSLLIKSKYLPKMTKDHPVWGCSSQRTKASKDKDLDLLLN